MALTIELEDPTIRRLGSMARVSLDVTFKDGEEVLHEDTVTHEVNGRRDGAKAALVAGMKTKLLRLRAHVEAQQALKSRLASLKAEIEAALAE